MYIRATLGFSTFKTTMLPTLLFSTFLQFLLFDCAFAKENYSDSTESASGNSTIEKRSSHILQFWPVVANMPLLYHNQQLVPRWSTYTFDGFGYYQSYNFQVKSSSELGTVYCV